MTRLTRPSNSTRCSDPNLATLPRCLRTTLPRPHRRSRCRTTPKQSSLSTSTLSSLSRISFCLVTEKIRGKVFGLRNLEVKVFGKVFGYWENLRESETEVRVILLGLDECQSSELWLDLGNLPGNSNNGDRLQVCKEGIRTRKYLGEKLLPPH